MKTMTPKRQNHEPMRERASTEDASDGRRQAWGRRLSYRNCSVLYLLVVLVVFFSITTPQTFWVGGTFRSILAQQAVTAILAIAVLVPLSAGGYDLSIGYTASLSSTVLAVLVVNQGWSVSTAIIVAVLCAMVVGVVNAIVVVRFNIDSFIATLASGAIVGSIIIWISGSQDISGLPDGFTNFAVSDILGLTYPTWVALGVAIVIWYCLEYTPSGRYVYATGGGLAAARLSGIRTERIRGGSFVVSSALSGVAGVLDLSRLGVASSGLGSQYLLPAFAAALLGATQFKRGRPNVWGAVAAIVVLAIGTKGFELLGLEYWLNNVFYGLALLAAVGLAASQSGGQRRGWSRLRRGTVASG